MRGETLCYNTGKGHFPEVILHILTVYMRTGLLIGQSKLARPFSDPFDQRIASVSPFTQINQTEFYF